MNKDYYTLDFKVIGGTIYTPSGPVEGDSGVRNERIVAIANPGELPDALLSKEPYQRLQDPDHDPAEHSPRFDPLRHNLLRDTHNLSPVRRLREQTLPDRSPYVLKIFQCSTQQADVNRNR